MTVTREYTFSHELPPAGPIPGSPGTFDPDDPLHGELLSLNVGPQHPATHGVLRLMVTLDGETIHEMEPVVGYLHRGKEKAAESLGWRKFFAHTDRLDYVQPLLNNVGYALTLEKLAGVEVPERAQVLRVLLMELSRIMAHLIYLGTTSIDLGAVSMFFFTFEEREHAYNILDAYTGHRMNHSFVRLGGVYADVDADVEQALSDFIDQFPAKIDQFESLLTGNRIWHDRNRNVGILSADEAKSWSLTGPNLRGSGVPSDLRKDEPYSGYADYDFEVPVGTIGDCYDRYLVRVEEMRQATRLCRQALERLKQTRGAPVLIEDRRYVLPPKQTVHSSMEELIHQFKIVTDMPLPAGEAYQGVESSKGELGFYAVSDGTSRPVRCHIRAPGLMNVQVIPLLARGRLFSDTVAIIGSLDFVMGEVDR
ncbi:MAG: NADH-quinone oxidoreductase subunit D [Planctomycetes bacterium]|jgi:NADH-quinone oxidoreductase subunit D|nr:NADH-quinone oxidoreductase subunit D [Planctomycetota bacterium]HJO26671.1 NADH-quinone oxidoreductase subunit D [Planctomycetota bacterium]